MSRKKKPLPLLRDILIEDIAAEGKCLFHVAATQAADGTMHYSQPMAATPGMRTEASFVVFVPFCVPGDRVDVQLRRKKHSYAEGEVVRLVEPSPRRCEPMCEHFGVCGGCKWQNLPYPEQLAFKQKQVFDQLTRIGKVELPEFMPIKGSVMTQAYRNKLDFGCSNKQWLTPEDMAKGAPFAPAIGFHITGAFDKILPIRKCWLMDDLHNQIRNSIFQYATAHGLSFFDLRRQTGLLRDVILRCSNTGEWMVILQFHYDHTSAHSLAESREQARGLLQHLADTFSQITALLYLDNQKCNDTIGDQEISVFKGKDHIFLQMEDLRFKVGPKSFYQTNTEQAYILYKIVRDFAFQPLPDGDTPADGPLVFDLYTGTGTIANFVAGRSRRVIGIEYVPEAIEDAKVNSEINGIGNTIFFAGDMKDILTDDFISSHGRPDVIITDPPRAGMHPDVIRVILNARPSRIVYVSCNPATQARDLSLLCSGYKVMAVQPVDMFPHTPHVENVVLLSRVPQS